MFLEEINLNFIQPCTTDSKRIRIIATPSRDVSELFPYLNTYLKTAIYNKKGQTLTYNYGPKIIVITKDDIKVYSLDKLLADWNHINGISLTIKQDDEIPANE